MVWPSWADYGDVPAWFGTVITSGSFVVAASALARGAKARESAQAELVNVTLARSSDRDTVYIAVQNRSPAPIYKLSGSTTAWVGADVYLTTLDEVAFVSPTKTDQHHSHAWSSTCPIDAPDVGVSIRFRDAAGRWWSKSDSGQLSRRRRDLDRRRRRATVRSKMPSWVQRTFTRFELRKWKRSRREDQ